MSCLLYNFRQKYCVQEESTNSLFDLAVAYSFCCENIDSDVVVRLDRVLSLMGSLRSFCYVAVLKADNNL